MICIFLPVSCNLNAACVEEYINYNGTYKICTSGQNGDSFRNTKQEARLDVQERLAYLPIYGRRW